MLESFTTTVTGEGRVSGQASLLFNMFIALAMPDLEIYVAQVSRTFAIRASRLTL